MRLIPEFSGTNQTTRWCRRASKTHHQNEPPQKKRTSQFYSQIYLCVFSCVCFFGKPSPKTSTSSHKSPTPPERFLCPPRELTPCQKGPHIDTVNTLGSGMPRLSRKALLFGGRFEIRFCHVVPWAESWTELPYEPERLWASLQRQMLIVWPILSSQGRITQIGLVLCTEHYAM